MSFKETIRTETFCSDPEFLFKNRYENLEIRFYVLNTGGKKSVASEIFHRIRADHEPGGFSFESTGLSRHTIKVLLSNSAGDHMPLNSFPLSKQIEIVKSYAFWCNHPGPVFQFS